MDFFALLYIVGKMEPQGQGIENTEKGLAFSVWIRYNTTTHQAVILFFTKFQRIPGESERFQKKLKKGLDNIEKML